MPDRNIIVKVRVNLSIDFHISPEMYIGSKNNEITWINFRYEKLPLFYFYYGLMVYSEEYCKKLGPPTYGIEGGKKYKKLEV